MYDVPQESLCAISQQVYGWVCDVLVIKISVIMFFVVAWPDLGVRVCYKLVSEPMVSTVNLDGPRMCNLESKFHRELMYRVI